jgi:RNA recognition motif-containing protein
MSEQQQNGQRRNNNRNQNNNRSRNNNRNRSNSSNNSNRKPRQNKPKPLVLSTWQKILIFLNITSEDKIRKQLKANRPARNKPSATATEKTSENKPARKNTRVAKEQKAPQKVNVETPRLYVGNLSYDATEYDIEDLFKGIGSVKKVEIIYNRHTHKSKGYGFVQMLNVDEAKRAVDVLHDQPFLGRNLIVNGSKPRKESDPNSSNYVGDEETSKENSEEPAA